MNDLNRGEKEKPKDLFCRMRDAFRVLARKASSVLGSPWAFIVALLIIAIWAITGPMFDFSDTWQLIINTGTTIVTFLMVFLIQNTQNRDAKAVHLKLDELIRALHGARNRLVDLEKLSDDEMKKLEEEFERIHKKAKRTEDALNKSESVAAA
jgi:low affinity Fe/Cu permease